MNIWGKNIPGRKNSIFKGFHRLEHACHGLSITRKPVCLEKGKSKGEMVDKFREIVGSQVILRTSEMEAMGSFEQRRVMF